MPRYETVREVISRQWVLIEADSKEEAEERAITFALGGKAPGVLQFEAPIVSSEVTVHDPS